MNYLEIKQFALFQMNNDKDDLEDFLPSIETYINDGYDRLLEAWANAHVGDEAYPPLVDDLDEPRLPHWTHRAIADYATYLLYRNGNPQKQQRGMQFLATFDEMLSRIYALGGAKGKRDRFINIYP